MENDEIWRPIEGAAKYEVSNLGRVRKGGKLRMLRPSTKGYLYVSVDGKSHRVHRLVARAFIGPQPSPQHTHVAHWDGDKTNNRDTNLRYATPRENNLDRTRHGYTVKLTNAQVRAILVLVHYCNQAAVSRHYGVSEATISHIVNGRYRSDPWHFD